MGGAGGGANLRNIVLDEGDEAMGGEARSGYQSGRARPAIRGYKPRGGHHQGRGGGRGGRGAYVNASAYVRRGGGGAAGAAAASPHAGRSWHKVQLNNAAARYTKEELLPALAGASAEPFAPICFQKTVSMCQEH